MSLNFETKNWKFEVTLEALHIHPITSDDREAGSRRDLLRTITNQPSVTDYFLSKTIVPQQSSIIEQE